MTRLTVCRVTHVIGGLPGDTRPPLLRVTPTRAPGPFVLL